MPKAIIVAIIFAVAISCPASDLPASFEQAARLGESQESAPVTKAYFNDVLLPYYGKTYAPVLQKCFANLNQADGSPFSFVAAIDSDGKVMRIYNDHATNVFLCLRDSLKAEVFPKPPVSPYYLHIDMNFDGNAASGQDSNSDQPPLIVGPDKYSYTFGVPKGWEFSFDQAHERGATLAFFPKGGNFNDSSSVIYVNEIDAGCTTHCMSRVDQNIASTIRDAKKESPAVQVVTAPAVETKEGGKALIRVLKGGADPRDETGRDTEALAFIGHDETIILVVLTARDPSTWDRDYEAFRQVVVGHKFFNCNSPNLRVPCKQK